MNTPNAIVTETARQFRTFGRPDRDPRGHTVSIVYVAELVGELPAVAGAMGA